MKGVLLAGGTGSRLLPLTKVTNKHLLPVFNKPMIYYPLGTLIGMGMSEILVVSGTEHCGHISQLLGSGKDFDVRISYRIQDAAGGIGQALSLAEEFAGGESVTVILGDNIFEEQMPRRTISKGAHLFLKETETPERFGVANFRDDGTIYAIEEKPEKPLSNLAVTGLYVYDNKVFDVIRDMRPSRRGEIEITDVNNWYLRNGLLSHTIVQKRWTDAGTFESLFAANEIARSMRS